MWSFTNLVFVATVVINWKCSAVEVCGLEDLPYCDPKDTTCMLGTAEPGARRWLIKGQKDYFVDPVESYVVEVLPLKVNNEVYKLEKVKFNGFENLKLTDWKLDVSKMLLTYDYDYNMDISIEKFTDSNGDTLIGNKTLLVHLVNTHTSTTVTFGVIKRCDGTSYFTFINPSIKVSDITNDQVTSEIELEEEILKELAKTITFSANRILSKAWRQLSSSVPIKKYWNIEF